MERSLASVGPCANFDKLTSGHALDLASDRRDVECPTCFQFSLGHQRFDSDVVPLNVEVRDEVITVTLKQIAQGLKAGCVTVDHIEPDIGYVFTDHLLEQLGQHLLCYVTAHRLLAFDLGKQAGIALLLCCGQCRVVRHEQCFDLVRRDGTLVPIHSCVDCLLDLPHVLAKQTLRTFRATMVIVEGLVHQAPND